MHITKLQGWRAYLQATLKPISVIGVVVMCATVFFGRADAAVNRQINFQGKIVLSSNSTNITNGIYNMQFRIYSGGDGVPGGGDETLLWTEDRLRNASQGVTITDGIFQVNLGAVTALPGSVDFNNDTLWLSINLGNTNASCTPFSSCSGDGEMNPMVRFTAAPYAFNTDLFDGLDSAAFGQLSQNQTWTGTQTFQPSTNITGAIIRQTSAGSPTADIFNVQTANSTNVLQVTGPAANEAAVTLQSIGATRNLTLDSGSGTLVLGTNTTALQKVGTALSVDLSSASASTLTITNSGAGVASLSVEGDISTTGTVNANNFDRTTSGTIALGNTNATVVSLCNSANCDTVQIANNADADTVTIGDASDTLGINGATTVTGAVNINTSGTANTTIGNSAGGTVTIGASSGSDLVLNDPQWSVTGAGAATFASVSAGSGTITTSGTIGTAGTTTFTGGAATFAGTVNINTTGTASTTIGNTAGGTITIGGSSGSNLVLQDAEWGITGAGAATFTSVNAGSGTITTTGTIGTAGTTTFTGAGATFSAAIAANGGITFDNAADTVGAHTLSGTVDANTNILTNIGNAGTDFIASTGALTLAGVLTANGGITVAANQDITFTAGTGTLTLNSTVNNASDNALVITPSFTGGGTDALTYNGISLTAFSPANAAGTDNVNGFNIGNLTDPGATITSAAVRVGTGWDTIFAGTTAGTNLFGFTNFTVTSAGAVTATSLNTGSGTIQTTGSVLGNSLDRTTAGSLTLGDTTATTVSVCNSAACDTVSIATNADADAVNIGDSSDTITFTGGSSSTFVFNGTTVSTSEFNLLDTKDAALVDQNDFISGDGVGATSSGSGLEAGTGGIGLIQGCSNSQVLKWNEVSSLWECGDSTYKKFISVTSTNVVDDTNNTADQAMTNVDITAQTSATATDALLAHNLDYTVQTTGDSWTAHIDVVGSSVGQDNIVSFLGDNDSTAGTLGNGGQTIVALNASQQFAYGLNEIISGATVTFRINVVGYWDVVNTGADLAENYYTNDPSIKPGDVVCVDPTYERGVKKCSRPYDPDALGVVSTQPGIVLDDVFSPDSNLTNLTGELANRSPAAVALAGRVPANVSTENGPIKAGDYLTPSSVPGVAMRATKAGKVIGQALFSHDKDEVGAVMMFVMNNNSLGSSLEEMFPGVTSDSAHDAGQNVLASLVANKQAVDPALSSDIFTDRLAAGLEIITPQLTSDIIRANILRPSTSQDLTVELGANNRLVIRGANGDRAVSFDTHGNVDIAGSLAIAGGLVVAGDTTFGAKTEFGGQATFAGGAVFDNSTGGYALVRQGEQAVEVKFAKPKDEALPIVTVSIKNGRFVPFAYKDLDKDGFKIVLENPAPEDIEFSWTALVVKEPISSETETVPAE